MIVSTDGPRFEDWAGQANEAGYKLLTAILDWNRSLDALIDTATSYQENGLQIDKDLLIAGHHHLVPKYSPLLHYPSDYFSS